MIHYITEGGNGNQELRNRRWFVPNGVLKYLRKVKEDADEPNLKQNPTTKEALDHLNDMLTWNTKDNRGRRHGVTYQEMKRIKNWFEENSMAVGSPQYELYGGDKVKTWVTGALNSATAIIDQQKEAAKAAGKLNVYNKAHKKDSTKVSKVDNKTPTYNPATGDKQKMSKELLALKEGKTIILNEEQRKEIAKLFIKK